MLAHSQSATSPFEADPKAGGGGPGIAQTSEHRGPALFREAVLRWAFSAPVPDLRGNQQAKSAMKAQPILAVLLALIPFLPACNARREQQRHKVPKIVAVSPQPKAVALTEQYVCQLRSQRHCQIRAPETGYVEEVAVQEGQAVKQGDLLFTIVPILYQKSANNELAGAKLAELAAAGLSFANVKAPFDGLVDRLQHPQGSLVQQGDTLTTLSDNSVMGAYFNVPEVRYLEYMADLKQNQEDLQVELVLASGLTFPQVGKIDAIDADFNKETGNIAFRADFPNPDGLLRHGQAGSVLIHRVLTDALVIPQRATFELLDKRYVYVVDKDDVVHQREIVIQSELEDVFVIKQGVSPDDKIVLEGVRGVSDGEKVEYEAP